MPDLTQAGLPSPFPCRPLYV